ncbi:MAG TPA: ABC transporter substrate-binding protein [Thermoleophilaceae bacterium]
MNSKLSSGLAIAFVAAVAAGCGGGGGGGGGTTPSNVGENAKTVTPGQAQNAKGNVNWCIGKDTTGAFSQVVKLHNQQNPNVKVKLTELPTAADEQRNQLIQRLRAKSPECDVLGMDVIWTGEFAGQNWLLNVTPAINARKNEFIPSTINTAKIGDKYWAVPFNTNAGFIYYDKSKVKTPPSTWQQTFSMAKSDGGFAFQGAQYEGLTVNFLEMLYAAGGTVLNSDGSKSTVDSPQAEQVLTQMQNNIKDGAAPKANLTYMEEESKRAWLTDKDVLLRNWPYVYAQAVAAKKNFGVTPLPKWQGGASASVIGGYNLGISAYSKNPGGALEFINFATAPAAQKKFFIKSSLPAVLTSVYTDPEVKKKVPFAAELLKGVQQGKARPVSPVYPQISEAIFKNVYSALQGTSPKSALQKMQSQINAALKTF